MPDEFGRFFEFPPFRFDLADKILTSDGQTIALPTRAAEILAHLIQNRDRLVSRKELREKFWSDLYVADNTIDRQVSEIRRALRSQPNSDHHIETQSKKGWRLVVDVAAAGQPSRKETVETPATNQKRRWNWLWPTAAAALAAMIAAVSLWISAARQPAIKSVVQLTYDGGPKNGPLLTDGRRLFFLELVGGSSRVFSVPISGGECTMLNIPLPNLALEGISWNGAKLLLRSEAHEGYSLWSYSLATESLQRLCGGFARGSWASDGTLAAMRVPKYRGDSSSIVILGRRGSVRTDIPGEIGDLAWSPDGTKLRFSLLELKRESRAQWEMDRQGAAKRVASLSGGHTWTSEGSWSRDGKNFVYTAGSSLQRDLWIVRDKPFRLTNGGPGSWGWPIFSHDGSTIFAAHRSVRSELVRLDENSNSWQPEWRGAAAFELDYSRDAKWAAYTRFPDHTIWKARPDGTDRVQLTNAQVEAHQPHWSPDGTQVAFMGKNKKGQWRVMQVPANGGIPEELFPNGQDQGVPTWSPDGSKLIFGDLLGRRGRDQMGFHEIDVKAKKLVDMQGSRGLWSPRWSPNGKYIAAITSESRALGVLLRGKAEFLELARMIYVDNATWSADSRHIYFNGTSPSGKKGLFRVSVPRGKLEQIADLTNFEPAPENWYGVTPDGTPLAFQAVNVQEIFALKCDLR